MEVRRAVALIMILTGLALAPFIALGAVDTDWEFGQDWDHQWDHGWDDDWHHDGHGHNSAGYSGPLDEPGSGYSGPLDEPGSGYSGPLDEPGP